MVSDKGGAEPSTERGNQDEPGTMEDPNFITWDGPSDKANPMNWTRSFRWLVTASLGSMTLCVAIASSIFSTGTAEVAELYDVSVEVATLGTALFILVKSRRVFLQFCTNLAEGFLFRADVLGSHLGGTRSQETSFLGDVCILHFSDSHCCRPERLHNFYLPLYGWLGFLSGADGGWRSSCRHLGSGNARGSCLRFCRCCLYRACWYDDGVPDTVVPGTLVHANWCTVGPIMGGFISMSYLGWRWNAYITLIVSLSFCVAGVFIVPETFGPSILHVKAQKIRMRTKNWAIHSSFDTTEVSMKSIVQVYLKRPYAMLFREPLLLLVTIYMSLIYGILYLFFEAYPISFQQQRGWNAGVGALPFLGLLVGLMAGAGVAIYLTKTRFARSIETHGRVIPEERLPPMILGAVLLPAGLFWFAWTSSPGITWVPQVLSGIPIGMGVFLIFLQGMNYIIDVYLQYANSAMAANIMLRSISGAAFPLFTQAMYDRLGVNWATSLLAFLCVAMLPVPVLFYYYGSTLRKKSSFSPNK